MRTVQDIVFGVGGSLVFDAPEGRPSAVTLTVYRWRAGDASTPEVAAAAASVEANPSTTTDAACGFDQTDPTLVPLTATTGATIGRTYLLTGSFGQYETVEVLEVSSGVSITAKHPLVNSYASGATFQSTRCSAVVDSTWAADTSNLDDSAGPNAMYRARWAYVVGGVTFVADTYFNLVRYAGRHGVTPQDVDLVSSGWMDRLPIDHRYDQGRRLIDDAYREVKFDLHGIDLDDSAIAQAEVIDELTRYKAAALVDGAELEKRYVLRRDQLVRIVSRVPVRNATGAAQPGTTPGLSRR